MRACKQSIRAATTTSRRPAMQQRLIVRAGEPSIPFPCDGDGRTTRRLSVCPSVRLSVSPIRRDFEPAMVVARPCSHPHPPSTQPGPSRLGHHDSPSHHRLSHAVRIGRRYFQTRRRRRHDSTNTIEKTSSAEYEPRAGVWRLICTQLTQKCFTCTNTSSKSITVVIAPLHHFLVIA